MKVRPSVLQVFFMILYYIKEKKLGFVYMELSSEMKNYGFYVMSCIGKWNPIFTT